MGVQTSVVIIAIPKTIVRYSEGCRGGLGPLYSFNFDGENLPAMLAAFQRAMLSGYVIDPEDGILRGFHDAPPSVSV